ncbi:integrase core domain-containing protein, partial [Escherichia coli]|uniref:integrase core domain-containing protein n=1 Tax=Escherichia coli TaxID=562 RepID=UPI0021BA5170
FQNHTDCPLTDFRGKTSIFSHPVYLFLRKFSLQDSRGGSKELTGKALFMALRSQRPPAGLIHHSDRGSQYCAYDYRVIQEQFGLKTSMSRKGNCYDNAPMESFWGTLKNESLSHYRFNNRDEAISVIREYIEIFYNRQRRHSRLGNISPAAFREKYHQMTA